VKKPPAEINKEAGEVIAALRAGQLRIMEGLYDQFRKEFSGWAAKRFYSTHSDIEDAWQEAVLIFYERVMSGRLSEMRCSVKTFLFAVGYKWLLKLHRKLKRIWWTDEVDKVMPTDPLLTSFAFDDDIWEEERLLLRVAMKSLSAKCQEMLTLRHYDELDIAALVELYMIKRAENPANNTTEKDITKNNISSQLAQCLSKLKGIIKTMSQK